MESLFFVENRDNAFFHERVVDGRNNAHNLYEADVCRKSDPLLVRFLNEFSESDFTRTGLPKVFTTFLIWLQQNDFINEHWRKGQLNAHTIAWWLHEQQWLTSLPVEYRDTVGSFFAWGIIETLLMPIVRQGDSESARTANIINSLLSTNWRDIRAFWGNGRIFPHNDFLSHLHIALVEYSAFWHFVNHQVTANIDGSFGLFPEKKVRYFCRSYLGIHFDTMRTDPFMEGVNNASSTSASLFHSADWFPEDMNAEYKLKRFYAQHSFHVLKGVTDPVDFCLRTDREYSQFAGHADIYQSRRLLEHVSLSLLHFSTNQVPIRKCSLCGRFYIPIKNPTSEMNYCHRVYYQGNGKTCSYYHSHNQRGISINDVSTEHLRVDKAINSFRSTLSQSTLIDKDNGSIYLSILRDCLTIIKKTAKVDPSQVDECFSVLSEMKEVYSKLKKKTACPNLSKSELSTRNSDLHSVTEMLSHMCAILQDAK